MKYVEMTPSQVENLDPTKFPLSISYLTPRYKGLYTEPEFQWIGCVVDELTDPLIAVLCVTTNRVLPNSYHLSVFEVRSDYQGQGIGSMVMDELVETSKFVAQVITLQCRTPELEGYYSKFGFRPTTIDGCRYMRRYTNTR